MVPFLLTCCLSHFLPPIPMYLRWHSTGKEALTSVRKVQMQSRVLCIPRFSPCVSWHLLFLLCSPLFSFYKWAKPENPRHPDNVRQSLCWKESPRADLALLLNINSTCTVSLVTEKRVISKHPGSWKFCHIIQTGFRASQQGALHSGLTGWAFCPPCPCPHTWWLPHLDPAGIFRKEHNGTQRKSEKALDLIQLVFIIKGLENRHVRTLYRIGERRGSLLKRGAEKQENL